MHKRPRNHIAHGMRMTGIFKTKVAKSDQEKARLRDPWERDCKHKNGFLEAVENNEHDEVVDVSDNGENE